MYLMVQHCRREIPSGLCLSTMRYQVKNSAFFIYSASLSFRQCKNRQEAM